jgi:hypothetical protein
VKPSRFPRPRAPISPVGRSCSTTAPRRGVPHGHPVGRGGRELRYARRRGSELSVERIQNGSPDGFALVDNTGALVEFLSYEGTFAATDGPAAGVVSTDIGVSENGTEPVGLSLARGTTGAWSAAATNSFGACNDDAPAPAAVALVSVFPTSASLNVGATLNFSASALDIDGLPVDGVSYTWTSSNPAIAAVNPAGLATGLAPGDTTITAMAPNGVAASAALHVAAVTFPAPSDFHVNEIHYDNVGVDTGEAVEVDGPAGAALGGYLVVLYNGNGGTAYNTVTLSGSLPASCGARGVTTVTYPQDGIQNGAPDGVAIIDATGVVLDFVSYEGVFTATTVPPRDSPRATSASRRPMRRSARRCSVIPRVCGPPAPRASAHATPMRRRRSATRCRSRAACPRIRRCRWVSKTSCSRRCAIRRTSPSRPRSRGARRRRHLPRSTRMA